ncbi:hypothetical protein FRC08_006916, partial [Ceratobasidium sp. 394]
SRPGHLLELGGNADVGEKASVCTVLRIRTTTAGPDVWALISRNVEVRGSSSPVAFQETIESIRSRERASQDTHDE